MIYITDFTDQEIRKLSYQERFAIVRSYKHPSALFKHLPVLAPSTELFYRCQELKQERNWNQETFEQIYVPNYLKQMHGKEEIATLDILCEKSLHENIILACFCHDESHCHRSILTGLLQGAGIDVHTKQKTDYRKYWELYNQKTYWENASLY